MPVPLWFSTIAVSLIGVVIGTAYFYFQNRAICQDNAERIPYIYETTDTLHNQSVLK